ncbi:MAG: hypothetical protein IPK27_00005, partial [Rhodanobacteraceae bacterium]|nr:hypothetical protein [Rhodanobacteraceae bacterium]
MKTIARGLLAIVLGWAALGSPPARAIELCVNSVGTLQQALALYPLHNGGRLTIKVVQGSY